MKNIILQLLMNNFHPIHINISDVSASHADHNEAAQGGGTHFNLTIVSEKFHRKSPVERHKMIYKILEVPLKRSVHALAIKALSPEEYHLDHQAK